MQNNVFDSINKSKNIVPQQPVKPLTSTDKKERHEKDMDRLYAGIGLSLVTLSTLGGIYYFAKRGGAKIKTYSSGGTTQTLGDYPSFYSNNATFLSTYGNKSQTIMTKPKWDAVTGGFSESPVTETLTEATPKRNKNWRERRNEEVIPGIIRQISTGIKDYIKRCGIDKNNNKINPEALDEILTKAVGEEHTVEKPYLVNGIKGKGRVKEYTSPNGRIYVLETHDSPKGVITRLFMQDKDKHLRAYLHADGTFRLNSYTSEEAHFDTTAKGKRWMEKSKFNTDKS